jgi:hypothetical protein
MEINLSPFVFLKLIAFLIDLNEIKIELGRKDFKTKQNQIKTTTNIMLRFIFDLMRVKLEEWNFNPNA